MAKLSGDMPRRDNRRTGYERHSSAICDDCGKDFLRSSEDPHERCYACKLERLFDKQSYLLVEGFNKKWTTATQVDAVIEQVSGDKKLQKQYAERAEVIVYNNKRKADTWRAKLALNAEKARAARSAQVAEKRGLGRGGGRPVAIRKLSNS